MSYFTTIHKGAPHPKDCQTGLYLDAFWQGYLDSMLAMLTAASSKSTLWLLMVDIQQQYKCFKQSTWWNWLCRYQKIHFIVSSTNQTPNSNTIFGPCQVVASYLCWKSTWSFTASSNSWKTYSMQSTEYDLPKSGRLLSWWLYIHQVFSPYLWVTEYTRMTCTCTSWIIPLPSFLTSIFICCFFLSCLPSGHKCQNPSGLMSSIMTSWSFLHSFG